jgi:hypothetical protein
MYRNMWRRPLGVAGYASGLVLILLACAKPPVITSVRATPNPVQPNSETEVSAVAGSPSGETITYHWYVVEPGSGTLLQNTGNPVIWAAGKLSGTFHVALRVLDQRARAADDTLAIEVANPGGVP